MNYKQIIALIGLAIFSPFFWTFRFLAWQFGRIVDALDRDFRSY